MKANTLDRLDLRILDVLQDNGRITNKELAEAVNLSPSACHQRFQRLLDDGWITNFNGVLDIERLCTPVQCIATMTLSNHSPNTFKTLEHKVLSMPEVLEAFTVSGSCDFIARFACSSMTKYMALSSELIEACPEVANISTHVIMQQSKVFKGYPLKSLLD